MVPACLNPLLRNERKAWVLCPISFLTRGQGFVICKPSIRSCMMTNLACCPKKLHTLHGDFWFQLDVVRLEVVISCHQSEVHAGPHWGSCKNPLGCRKKNRIVPLIKKYIYKWCLFSLWHPFNVYFLYALWT